MNVFWLVVIACAVILIQMFIFRRAGLRGIQYSRHLSVDRANIGDRFEMVEDIYVRRFVPLPWLRAESRIPASLSFASQTDLNIEDELFHRSVFTLLPYRHVRRRYKVTCNHRGLFDLSSVTLTTGDILGLHTVHRTLLLDVKLLVYPQIMDFSVLDLPSKRWQGDIAVRRWIQPDPFLVNGIREYRLGDNQRDIHAGATARTGSLQVKTHDFTASPQMMFVLNVQISENQWGVLNPRERESMETALSLAATMVAWCRSQRIACGLASNGVLQGESAQTAIYLRPMASQRHYDDCMEALARMLVQRRVSFPGMLAQLASQLPTEPLDIVVLSCYWSEEIEEAAQQLRALGHGVTHYPVMRKENEDEADTPH